MNSRSSVNETNLVNFSADLSTLNQLDSKDGLLSFPFDHIYACHSDEPDRRPALQLDKEVEVSTHCVVGEEKTLTTPTEIHKLQDQLSAFENQNKRLKDLLIYHLDLIQQQNELISKRDKLYQTLKQENDTLRAKLMRAERRVAISPRTQALNAAYHASKQLPTSTVTSGSMKNQPTTSEIVLNSFSELLLPSNGSMVVDQTPIKETFGIARLHATPEQIAAYTQDPDRDVKKVLKASLVPPEKMIDKKRSLIKKEVRKEILEESARTGALGTKSANSRKPILERLQAKRRATSTASASAKVSRAKVMKPVETPAPPPELPEPSEPMDMSQMPDLSELSELPDLTEEREDPYQLGEAEMREQSPIQKLMLKPNNKRKSTKLYAMVDKKKSRYLFKDPSKIIMKASDLEMVKTEPDIDWRIYNKNHDNFAFFNDGENLSSSLPSLDANEFQELFNSDVNLDNLANLDNINTLDYTPALPDKSKKRAGRTTSLMDLAEEDEETTKRGGQSNRGRKRAFSATGLIKQTKTQAKPRGSKAVLRAKIVQAPPPGITTNKPYDTVIADPDMTWYFGLDPDVKLEDIDHLAGCPVDTVEVPQWREKIFPSSYTLEGTENMNEKVFEKRHSKLEAEERRQLRWHMRRIREQRHMERLRQRHRDAWSSSPVTAPSVYTVWPRPQRDMSELQIAKHLPVGSFGEDVPDLPSAPFKLPWVRTSKALKRSKRSKTLH
ncbi:protein male-specific lethal-1-like isoform X2 [Colias croceus]|uniref:protein male-specific lethal-1-like isoform X2 n=1 Tax=Colias crocea TaxID=72248 RepID=UPI001E27D198|nr:protein male-specific lethal-1-like isoform X2 [Colias croceus]